MKDFITILAHYQDDFDRRVNAAMENGYELFDTRVLMNNDGLLFIAHLYVDTSIELGCE